MTQDEIIEMARQADVWVAGQEPYQSQLEAFAKLVADKARQELREEIIYTWVPPSFVDFAIKTEREACAKVCESLFDLEDDTCDEAEKCAKAIRARGEA